MKPEFYDFGLIKKGETDVKEFTVYNLSENCTAYITPADIPFIHDGIQMKKQDQNFEVEFEDPYQLPYQLATLDSFKFKVRFTAVESGLWANSFDWGKRTIDRNNFPAGPYDGMKNSEVVITVKNTGTQKVTIYSINRTSEIRSDAFEFPNSQTPEDIFTGMEIDAEGSVEVPVKFYPKEVGYHELTFNMILVR